MKTITEKDGVFYCTNYWHKNYGCKYPTIIDCMWIWTDDEINTFQKWLDKKGGSYDKEGKTNQ